MAVIQTPWNQYEIALLIETYVNIKDGKISRKDGITQLSRRLRYRVLSQGGIINDQYRNENGIQLELAEIAYVLTDGEKGKKGASKAFFNIAFEYTNNPTKYSHILFLAEQLYPIPIIKDNDNDNNSEYVEKNDKVVSETSIIYKSKEENKIRKILEEKFKKYFRLNSAIEIRRFRKFYEEFTGADLENNDEELVEIIKDCGIINDEKVYLPENVMSSECRTTLFDYVNMVFHKGGTFIYYAAILEQLHDMFLDTLVTDRQSLKAFMEYFDDQGWFYNTFYIAKSKEIKPDLEKYVLEYLKYEGDAVEDEKICENVPYDTKNKVQRILNLTPDSIISTGREGKHFHIDNFSITGYEKQGIRDLIKKILLNTSYITFDELSEHIKLNYPNVFKDNLHFSELGIRNALRALFSKDYDFSNNIISKKGISASDIFKDYCLTHESFTIEEMENLANEFKTLIPFDTILEYCVRVSHDQFLSKKQVKFDVEEVDKAIGSFINEQYRCLASFDNFTIFPSCGYPWNEYLLESYVMQQSHDFMLWHNRFLKDYTTGVIVRRNTTFSSYEEVIVDAVSKDRVKLNEMEVLDFLQEKRFIARRKKSFLKELSLLEKAAQLRNKK